MVTLDTVFEILSDKRRRYVLYYLREQNGPVPVEELVEVVRRWEDEPPEQDSTSDAATAIEVELIHKHLPKTAEIEFVQYNPEQEIVQVQGSSAEFDAIVTIARIIERPEDA